MVQIDHNQPLGTPTWMDLAVPDLAGTKEFYGAVFGWTFAEDERGTVCRLRGLAVAGLREETPGYGWEVHIATDDCAGTVERATAAGGVVVREPHDVGQLCRAAIVTDPTGTRFGLWQGRSEPGCRLVNEPDTLVRNDLVTPDPGRARDFYTKVFDFTLDGNDVHLPGVDFTFLRRPDGHEIGGILGTTESEVSLWETNFAVADADETMAKVAAAGGTAGELDDMPYARVGKAVDPFGNEFLVGSQPK
ncbi:VOC family protein [Kibdelosporangium phytohabitans]|uniref:Glyoxalase n=1 Tax=Kibdelosporangium phytohabitans TaxID=860235 RepID=A0A0N9I7E7_9PSEU|nr:VOC family protein [Kibdelosporangium phytohabitans]ALG12144.1 glyoxalase [Kibdelosporangium phytohabitans]MBE1463656.1 putative enzyme related to lactoylglutathione lyase [Kibdelosporangium phytohabitans]